MARNVRYIFVILICIVTVGVIAQPLLQREFFRMNHLSVHDGLDNMRVFSILQGQQGEMWISTRNGINRYNGSTIQNYQLGSNSKVSNAAGRVISLAKGPDNHLFAYDNKGNIYQYVSSVGKFNDYIILNNKLGGDIKLNRVYYDHTIWLALRRGIYQLNNDKLIKVYDKDEANDFVKVGNQIIAGLNHGVLFISDHSNKFKFNVLKGSESYNVQSLYFDSKTNYLWVGTLIHGVRVYDLNRHQWINSPQLDRISGNPVRSFASYDSNTLLIGVDGAGIYKMDRYIHESSLFLNSEDETSNALTGNGIYSICVDKDRNIWMGSYTGGVDVAYPSEVDVRFFRHEYKDTQSLLNNNVNDICETADGTLWMATDIGLSSYHPGTGKWQHYLHNQVVITLCADGANSVYAGTYGNGVLRVSNGGSSVAYSSAKHNLNSSYITSIRKDKDGDLWIGNIEGFLTCIVSGIPKEFSIREIQCLTPFVDGRMGVGTTGGFYIVDKKTGHFQSYFQEKEFQGKDVNRFISSMVFRDNHSVWLGTDGGGVYLYDFVKRRIIKHYTTDDRLPSNSVAGLLKDKDGHLFISSDKGISMISNGNFIKNLSMFKGIEQEYNRMSCTLLHDGRIAFGGNAGAVVLQASQLSNLHYKAPLNFISLNPILSGKTLDEETAASIHEMLVDGDVDLSYSQNTFELSFECINYRFQHDIEYRYLLEGYDKQRLTMSQLRSLRYTNLPPGSYTLRVEAVSKTDGHVLDSKVLELNVAHPWYSSPLARIIYFLIIVALSWLVWRIYRNRLEKRYYNEKIDFFVNTAHDIRTPLSLVLAPLNDIASDVNLSEKSRKFLDMALHNGEKLMKMVTQLLDFQKYDTNHMQLNLQQVEVITFLNKEVSRFQPLAQQKNLKLSIIGEDSIFAWIDPSMVEIILDNLISNAIKYTPGGGSVKVLASVDNGKLSISVSDTGIGIPEVDKSGIFSVFYRAQNALRGNQKGSGLGLMISRKMAEKMDAVLSFSSREGEGTTFTLSNLALSPFIAPVLDLSSEEVTSLSNTDSKSQSSHNTLLFVDDNDELRKYIHMAFDGYYHIISVESGDKALDFLNNGGVCDIIVSDVMMPGIQGDELCRRVKDNPDTSWIPIILLTAKSGKDFMINGLHVGADDYITKPFDSELLKSKIDSILVNRRRLSEYYLNKALALAGKKEAEEQVPSDINITEDPVDKEFIDKATHTVLEHLSDESFDINALCREMAMSRTLFYGKLKTLTDKTPQEFIRLIRLEQASALLKQGIPVLEVATKTGFTNSKYFSTVYKKYFGISPSQVN